MPDLDPFRPHPTTEVDLAALAADVGAGTGGASAAARLELVALDALRRAGVPLAAGVLVAPAVEERFYRLNNLPDRLLELFAEVDPADPDEDDIEELAPRARTLLRTSYLLDEFIDQLYEAIAPLPPRVRVRRPGDEGRSATRGRPALLAVKGVWEDDWSFDALMDRLGPGGAFALAARPTLIHGDDEPLETGDLAAAARRALKARGLGAVRLTRAEGGVARVAARPLDTA